jgi:phage shock protein PspC (stress-responsive transcriptional regulator)
MDNKLYRSRTDSMLGGVCGGLGQYLGIDSTIVRLFFVLLAMSNGLGVLIYLLLWMIVPRQGHVRGATLGGIARSGAGEIAEHARAIGDDIRYAVSNPHPRTGIYIGAGLILLGVFYLLQSLKLSWLRWLDIAVLWPVLLILAGLVLLFRRYRGD